MTAPLPEFKLIRSTSLEDAVAALAHNKSARLCAGGTDLIVNMRHGLMETDTLIDVSNIQDLKHLEIDEAGLHIGAGVTLDKIAQNKTIAETYPAISQACLSIAGPSHRNAATLGGNLCLDTRCLYYNQSHWWRKSNNYCLKYKGDICHVAPVGKRCRAAYSGDLAPAFIALGAEIDIAHAKGQRRVPLEEFYYEDGADHLVLHPSEIVIGIHVPPTTAKSGYLKVRVRGAIDFPLAGVAVVCKKIDRSTLRFSVAITGTNSCPVAVHVPDLIEGEDHVAFFAALEKSVRKSISPQRTTTTGAHYRRLSVAALTRRLAKELSEKWACD